MHFPVTGFKQRIRIMGQPEELQMFSSKVNIPFAIITGDGLIGYTQDDKLLNDKLLKQNSMGWKKRMLNHV